MRRILAVLALLPALLLAACGSKDEPKATPTKPAADAPAAPASAPAPSPETPKPEPVFKPMGVGERPAASAAVPGRRLTGTWAKDTTQKPPGAGSAQVTMVNQTGITLDLYVDGGYGCRALMNLMCTTQVTPGTLTLEVRGPNGESASEVVLVEGGSSFTWTITQ